jgi:hypothetical protein
MRMPMKNPAAFQVVCRIRKSACAFYARHDEHVPDDYFITAENFQSRAVVATKD